MTDPFSNKSATATIEDPFGQPETGGSIRSWSPKAKSIEGRLVLFSPVEQFEQLKYEDKDGKTETVVTGELVILDGPEAGKVVNGWCVTGNKWIRIHNKLKQDGKPSALGRVVKVPTWPDVKDGKYKDGDTAAIEKALEEYYADQAATRGKSKLDEPKFAWSLSTHTEAEAVLARQFLATRDAPPF